MELPSCPAVHVHVHEMFNIVMYKQLNVRDKGEPPTFLPRVINII